MMLDSSPATLVTKKKMEEMLVQVRSVLGMGDITTISIVIDT